MITVCAPGAITKFHSYQDSASVQQPSYPYKINNINLLNCNSVFAKPFGSSCSNIFHSSSGNCAKQHKSFHLFHPVGTHKWLVSFVLLWNSIICVFSFDYCSLGY